MLTGEISLRVIHTIRTSDICNLFNPENVFISKEGGGAGNIWASGFCQAEKVQEHLLDMIGKALCVHTSQSKYSYYASSTTCTLMLLKC